jgi:hypothetical protein
MIFAVGEIGTNGAIGCEHKSIAPIPAVDFIGFPQKAYFTFSRRENISPVRRKDFTLRSKISNLRSRVSPIHRSRFHWFSAENLFHPFSPKMDFTLRNKI